MQRIGYYIALPFLYFVALLPFPLFYLFSDMVYVFLYHGIGYRKKVVYNNLKNAFPQKSEDEINQIQKKFYQYLCDMSLETFKTLTISKKAAIKHCFLSEKTIALFKKYADQSQNVMIVMGHYGNWEWAGNTFSLTCKQQLNVLYHPLSNPFFDNLMKNIRTRFGTKLIPMNDAFRGMVKSKGTLSATAFIADQTPSSGENAYITQFLNQKTAVFWGTEVIAKKMNYPVIYATVNRIKRGFYKIESEELVFNSAQTTTGEISEMHTKKLEADIINHPEFWLWSHRRWKHNLK